MRRELIYEIWMDLHGPRDKKNLNDPILRSREELSLNPLVEYLTGVLIPRDCNLFSNDSEEEEDDPILDDGDVLTVGSSSEEEEDDILASPPTELNPNQTPSSFGISFNVNSNKPTLELCITWARYNILEDDDKRVYKRKPFGVITRISINDGELKSEPIYTEDNNNILIYYKRSINTLTKENMVNIYFVNNLKCPERRSSDILFKFCVFQPQIRVNGIEGTRIEKFSYQNETILHLIYKNKKVLGRGYLCSALWKEIDYLNPNFNSEINPKIIWPDAYYLDSRNNNSDYCDYLDCDIRSEYLPIYPIISPNYFPKTLENERFSSKTISETWERKSLEKLLRPIELKYEEWIIQNENIIIDQNFKNKDLN
ncbi:hypothetical protein LCGC14_2887510, partial [marine sediment metagenome]